MEIQRRANNRVEKVKSGSPSSLAAAPQVTTTSFEPITVNNLREFIQKAEPFKYNIIAGFIFGVALQRGRVHESSIILGQMNFSHLVMLKMFLSASAVSILSSICIEKVMGRKINREGMTDKYPRGAVGVAFGAALLGLGMTLTGSCPGSVFVQFGSLSLSGLFVALGGLLGAIGYGHYEAFVSSTPDNATYDYRMMGRLPNGKTRVEDLVQDLLPASTSSPVSTSTSSNKLTHTTVGYGIAAAFLSLVLILEFFVNWRADLAGIIPSSETVSLWVANPPIVSGIMVGIAQFISLYKTERGMGCSSSFACVAARCFPNPNSPYFCRVGNSHLYQVASMGGVIIGSFTSALLTGSLFNYVGADISMLRQIIGGFLLVFGSQFSGGCTSGHGISGMSYLSTYALIGVCSMFTSAILSKVLFF